MTKKNLDSCRNIKKELDVEKITFDIIYDDIQDLNKKEPGDQKV
jgi:hypothetical protein